MRDGEDRLRLDPLTKGEAARAASWFLDDDEEARHELGGFYGSHPRWWELVVGDPRRHGWIVWAGNQRCGFVDLEVGEAGAGIVAIYVRRRFRDRGVGRAILRAVSGAARPRGAQTLSGGVHPHNARCLRMSLAAGASVVGTDADGYVVVGGVV